MLKVLQKCVRHQPRTDLSVTDGYREEAADGYRAAAAAAAAASRAQVVLNWMLVLNWMFILTPIFIHVNFAGGIIHVLACVCNVHAPTFRAEGSRDAVALLRAVCISRIHQK